MKFYRLLSPENDFEKLKTLLEGYYVDQKNNTNPVYPLTAIEHSIKNNLELFKQSSHDDIKNGFLISGAFEGTELTGCAIGRKLNHFWNIKHTILPSWALVLLYSKDRTWTSPRTKAHDLLNPIISTMEHDRFFSWYKVSKISNKINSDNIDNYLSNIYSKTISADRYFVTVEAIVSNQDELKQIKSIYRRMFPIEICNNRKLALMCHHYKNSLRNFQLD